MHKYIIESNVSVHVIMCNIHSVCIVSNGFRRLNAPVSEGSASPQFFFFFNFVLDLFHFLLPSFVSY